MTSHVTRSLRHRRRHPREQAAGRVHVAAVTVTAMAMAKGLKIVAMLLMPLAMTQKAPPSDAATFAVFAAAFAGSPPPARFAVTQFSSALQMSVIHRQQEQP